MPTRVSWGLLCSLEPPSRTRRLGTDTPVTINDRFHIGSDTKAMTALLAGMLVEEGKFRWNTTVGEIYPELVDKMSKGVKDITLEQLLSHTSGIPGDSMEHVPLISSSVTVMTSST